MGDLDEALLMNRCNKAFKPEGKSHNQHEKLYEHTCYQVRG